MLECSFLVMVLKMTKTEWQHHIEDVEGSSYLVMTQEEKKDVLIRHKDCKECAKRRKTQKATKRRQEKEAVYASCGLEKVRSVSGKVYWE
jgi:hypothetical protein